MAKQKSLKEAHEQGFLELSNWADLMIQRIKMNYEVQRIWPLGKGGGGPYKDYHIINAARRGKYRSTGESFTKQNLYSRVLAGAGGNTVAVDFFFRYYLFFVDWGVGKGQTKNEVPENGIPKMKKRYADWQFTGDRQRRPVVMGEYPARLLGQGSGTGGALWLGVQKGKRGFCGVLRTGIKKNKRLLITSGRLFFFGRFRK